MGQDIRDKVLDRLHCVLGHDLADNLIARGVFNLMVDRNRNG